MGWFIFLNKYGIECPNIYGKYGKYVSKLFEFLG